MFNKSIITYWFSPCRHEFTRTPLSRSCWASLDTSSAFAFVRSFKSIAENEVFIADGLEVFFEQRKWKDYYSEDHLVLV